MKAGTTEGKTLLLCLRLRAYGAHPQGYSMLQLLLQGNADATESRKGWGDCSAIITQTGLVRGKSVFCASKPAPLLFQQQRRKCWLAAVDKIKQNSPLKRHRAGGLCSDLLLCSRQRQPWQALQRWRQTQSVPCHTGPRTLSSLLASPALKMGKAQSSPHFSFAWGQDCLCKSPFFHYRVTSQNIRTSSIAKSILEGIGGNLFFEDTDIWLKNSWTWAVGWVK